MEPDNQPQPARSARRLPPDDPAPAPAQDLAPVTGTSGSASGLYGLLAGSDTRDGGQPSQNGGRDAVIDALTAPPPPPDPDLRLVTLGVRIPQYMATALRTMAFLRHRRQQELVREALLQYVPADLLSECRAAEQERDRGGPS